MDSSVQAYSDLALTQATKAPQAASTAQPSAASSATSSTGLTKLRGAAGDPEKASQDFEAMFMTQMLQPMFEGLGSDPTFGGGHGEEVMKTFLLQEYGKIAAKSGTLGIAAHVKDQMIKAQSVASASSSAGKGVSNAYAQ